VGKCTKHCVNPTFLFSDTIYVMSIKSLKTKPLPKAPRLKNLIGPSFVILGLGLGSGEVVLWPYLTSRYGMGIIWGAILGITFQFFMNMEIERYTLVHGESIFVGFARKLRLLPVWFFVSTFIPWIWPGITASAAKIAGSFFGVENTQYIAIALLLIIGLILSLGPALYKTVEVFQKVLILIGVPTVFALAIVLAKQTHWVDLLKGSIGIGNGYSFLPAGISISSFLAALAYAGAGGNLNLAQSFYIKAKGYGMGKYAGKIKSLLTGKQESIELTGAKFETTPHNLDEFKRWWKNINIEHLFVFWATGAVTMLLLGLLSYTTLYPITMNATGLDFLFMEGAEIKLLLFPLAGTVFLVVAMLTLISTQLGVFDATSRILSENLVLALPHKFEEKNIPKIYYTVLWVQILAGITIFLLGLTEPLQLLVIAAVLNAFTMFVHVGLTLWLNMTNLDKALRPGAFRLVAMALGFLFYGGFSVFTIIDRL
jgi:hypothetical protein